jgi:epoxyqueuosine reductase QueG
MNGKASETILAEARYLFDAVGVSKSEAGTWLILGLTTSPERNLDEFIRKEDGGVNFVAGFEKYMKPRLERLVERIRQSGIEATISGNCGYPRGSELNIKENAVAAGLGSWGRNSLLLHPEFGLDLRFAVIHLKDIRLPATESDNATNEFSPFCSSCHACEEACPVNIIQDGRLSDTKACLAAIENMTADRTLVWCRNCIDACPAGKSRS